MLTPTSGTIEVCGGRPASGPAQLAKVGFVAQDTPTYPWLSVADHLRLGARLNPRWDDALARARIERLGLDPAQRAGKLSGGQRGQLALTLGLAKRPELLILDEPVASLDPLARREFLQGLMEAVAEHELSVVLSSHLVADLERVCDHLVVLVDSQVRLVGEVDTLLATHHRLAGPRRDPATLPADFAVVLAITGPRLLDLSRAYPNEVFDQLTRTDHNLYNAGLVVLAVAPAVIGAFWGAPMVARELEAGTHRLAWSQTVTRTRWLATKLSVTALAAAAAVGVLTLAVSWWAGPLDGTTSRTHGSLPARLTPVAFAMRGVAPVGYAVFALALGVAVGIVLRCTVPAMAVTLAVFTFVQIAVPLWVRPHLVPPAQQTVTFTPPRFDSIMMDGAGAVRVTVNTGDRGDWVLSNETIDAAGQVTALPSSMGECIPRPPSSASGGPARAPVIEACFARLNELGYRQRVVYQPADRFWTLQWAETALFLALSGLLTGFCFWWTRHRLA